MTPWHGVFMVSLLQLCVASAWLATSFYEVNWTSVVFALLVAASGLYASVASWEKLEQQ